MGQAKQTHRLLTVIISLMGALLLHPSYMITERQDTP